VSLTPGLLCFVEVEDAERTVASGEVGSGGKGLPDLRHKLSGCEGAAVAGALLQRVVEQESSRGKVRSAWRNAILRAWKKAAGEMVRLTHLNRLLPDFLCLLVAFLVDGFTPIFPNCQFFTFRFSTGIPDEGIDPDASKTRATEDMRLCCLLISQVSPPSSKEKPRTQ